MPPYENGDVNTGAPKRKEGKKRKPNGRKKRKDRRKRKRKERKWRTVSVP